MKIRMNFGIVKTLIVADVLAGALAVIGLDIAMLAQASGFYNYSPAVPAVSLAAAVAVGIAAMLILFNSYYKFKQGGLSIVLGFFSDKIAYDNIVLLKQEISSNTLFIVVSGQVNGDTALKVNISASNTDKFIKGLREYIPNITVELFSKPKKEKDEN